MTPVKPWTMCRTCGRVVLKEHVNEEGNCLSHAPASVDPAAETREEAEIDLGRPEDETLDPMTHIASRGPYRRRE